MTLLRHIVPAGAIIRQGFYKNFATVLGSHRLGNTLITLKPFHIVTIGTTVSGIYIYRFYEGIKKWKTERKIDTKWMVQQMVLEGAISAVIMPFAFGVFKYNGPIPIPKSDYRTSSLRMVLAGQHNRNLPVQQNKQSNSGQTKDAFRDMWRITKGCFKFRIR